MISDEKLEKLAELLKGMTMADFYIFDDSALSTAVDSHHARWLIFLHAFLISIYEAIIDLYVYDLTGCLDSGLL